MSKLGTLSKIIKESNKLLVSLDANKLLRWMSDEQYVREHVNNCTQLLCSRRNDSYNNAMRGNLG